LRGQLSRVQIYEAFNSDGLTVVVSAAELDAAVRTDPPLSTELADAAAQARRTDLLGHLRASLDGDDRARKLSAAKALLALHDQTAIDLLDSRAETEPDDVVAKSYTAVATRLRDADAAIQLFCDPSTDPQLARLLVSNYNSHLRPDSGDVRFLICALGHYADRDLPWLTDLREDLWDNGIYLILNGLSNDHAVHLLRADPAERARLRALLPRVGALTEDAGIRQAVRSLQTALSGD
jgi:hypothetical protein